MFDVTLHKKMKGRDRSRALFANQFFQRRFLPLE
jgi:hypothetical protein